MIKVFAITRKEIYKTEIRSLTNNLIITDESVEIGGKDLGFSPEELLAASLSACISTTIRMYANRKGWDLDEVKVVVEIIVDAQSNKSVFYRKLELTGNLSEEQRTRILAIANMCHVSKILSNPISIETELD
jgi:putative redox protein